MSLSVPVLQPRFIVSDSYIENSIKDCERIIHAQQHEALEYVSMTDNSPIPVEMEHFWASSKNKEKWQILSRDLFVRKSRENKEIKILLSGYVTDPDGPRTCELLTDGESYEQPNLYSSIKEADSCIIPHIFEAVENGIMRTVVLSNDTDVAVYNIAHYERFRDKGMSELWICFGAGAKV